MLIYNILKLAGLNILCVMLFGFQLSNGVSLNEEDSLDIELSNASLEDSIEIITEKGRVNFKSENYQLALENFYAALELSEKTDDKKARATLINNIAAVYYKNDDLESALDYFQRSYDLERELGDKSGVSKSLNNIAVIYNEIGEYDKSLNYYEESLKLRKEFDDQRGVATVHNNIGLVYIKKKDYQKAIEEYNEVLEILQSLNDDKGIANTYGNLARAYLLSERYDQAINYVKKAEEITKNLQSPYLEMDNYMTLYDIYKKTGDYKMALAYHEKYEKIKDSLSSMSVAGRIDELKLRYETAEKEKENELLKTEREAQEAVIQTQNTLVISSVVVLLLLIGLSYAFHKNSNIKKGYIKRLEQQKIEIEKKNEESQQLNQVKNKLFSVISHEVRSPLNSLLGTVELLNSGVLSTEEFFKLSKDLKQKVYHTTNFLNNLLVWAKSQMQGISVQKESFDLEELINETIDLLKEQADMKGVELDRNFDQYSNVLADKSMISIVVKNLISNAIKFTHEGQKVKISTIKNGKFLKLHVEDQGIGISEENQSKILGEETFSTMGTAQEIGTGLGLILSKDLIHQNGGQIWLESEEGKGSVFTISIPLN